MAHSLYLRYKMNSNSIIQIGDFSDDESFTISTDHNAAVTWPFVPSGLDMSTITIAGESTISSTISTGEFIVRDRDLVVDGGDLIINGVGLSSRLDKIEERLGILKPNPEMESRWEQLKSLGEQYRQLEAELTERDYIFEQLKK